MQGATPAPTPLLLTHHASDGGAWQQAAPQRQAAPYQATITGALPPPSRRFGHGAGCWNTRRIAWPRNSSTCTRPRALADGWLPIGKEDGPVMLNRDITGTWAESPPSFTPPALNCRHWSGDNHPSAWTPPPWQGMGTRKPAAWA